MTDRRDDEHPTSVPNAVTDFETAKARVREKAEQAKKHDPLEKARHCLQTALERASDDPAVLLETDALTAWQLLLEKHPADAFRFRQQVDALPNAPTKALDRALRKSVPRITEEFSSISDQLIVMVRDNAELFHDTAGEPFATFEQEGHRETWALKSSGFRDWCAYSYYKMQGETPSDRALSDALTALSGVARYEGSEYSVWLRCAVNDDHYYLDMADSAWRVIEIDAKGWRIRTESPIRFRRTRAMRPLPEPTAGGDLGLLWQYANVPSNARTLLVTALLEGLRPETAFPVIELCGPQGSGKSWVTELLRTLLDPNAVPLRAAPKTAEDIHVSAHNNWLVVFNNLSHASAGMQDALCTLATGGGFATRKFYANDEESLIESKRLVILNGIGAVTTQQDLLDRVLRIELPEMEHRRRESDLRNAFAQDYPAILGGLLDLFVQVLKVLPTIQLDQIPRMADYAHLGTAVHHALHDTRSFNTLYAEARESAVVAALDSSPVAGALQGFIEKNPQGFAGTVKDLKARLEDFRTDGEGWPMSAKGLGDSLRRLAPALKLVGIRVAFDPARRMDGIHVRVGKILTRAGNSQHEVHHVHEVHGNPPSEPQKSGKHEHHELDEHVVATFPQETKISEPRIPCQLLNLTDDAAKLWEEALKLVRGSERPALLARKLGWNESRVIFAVQELEKRGLARQTGDLVKPLLPEVC
ncbi:MAG TPA: hypothetical protein P5330_00540 [Candidatus Competibacteraceae bacterium]|nr:hypothetical protein [Candidatus Competibacteraceae bacterium]